MRGEFVRRFDPVTGNIVYKHVYGEGIYDILSSVGEALSGKFAKKVASTAFEKGVGKLGEKTGEAIGYNIYDKIRGKEGERNR